MKAKVVNNGSTPVILVMNHFDVHCRIPIGAGRVLDTFNDQTTGYLEAEDVRVYQRAGGEPMFDLSKTVIVKENVNLVILVSEDRSSESRVFFAAQDKKTTSSVVSLPSVIVKGQIHLREATNARGFLSIQAASFFPITEATVVGQAYADTPLKSRVVLVRKDAVSSVALLPDA